MGTRAGGSCGGTPLRREFIRQPLFSPRFRDTLLSRCQEVSAKESGTVGIEEQSHEQASQAKDARRSHCGVWCDVRDVCQPRGGALWAGRAEITQAGTA